MNIDKRYILTYISCCLFVLSIGLTNSYSVFIVPLSETLNVGRGTITLAGTISDLISGFLSPLLIKALRRYHLKTILLISTLAYALTTVLIGIFPNVIMYFILNTLKGFIMIYYGVNIIIIIIGNWFEKSRQTLTGIAIAFTGVCGALFSIVFDKMINTTGLKNTFIVYGFIIIILALPAILYLKLKPEECGLTMLKENKASIIKEEHISKREYHLNDPIFIGISVIYLIMVFLTNVSIHFPGYAETIGFKETGATMVSAMMIGSILFKSIMGYICDHFGALIGYPMTIVLVFISFVLLILGKNATMLVLGSFIFGAIFASLIAINPLIRYYFGDTQYPEVFTAVTAISSISNLGGPLVGYLYDFTGTYIASMYMAVVLCVLAMIAFFAINKFAKK